MQMITNSRMSTRLSKIITTIILWSLNLVTMQSHLKCANKDASKEFEAFERYVLDLSLILKYLRILEIITRLLIKNTHYF